MMRNWRGIVEDGCWDCQFWYWLAWSSGSAPGRAVAETCLSPYVKRLDRPEKYLYVFCVDADAKDNDFFVVIDVNPDSGPMARFCTRSTSAPRGMKRITGVIPMIGRGSGRAVCSQTASGSLTWRRIQPSRESRK